jgi:apolipoprotein N-acyltransferase
MFDPYGRVLARLDLNVVGVRDVKLPESLPATIYSRVGDVAFAGGLLLIGAILVVRRLAAGFFAREI